MAGIGAGVFANYTEIHQWVEIGQEIEPDYTAHEVYDLNYSIFRELYDQTAYLMHKLR
jgi:sugar (pentulose or hexulose) kinase